MTAYSHATGDLTVDQVEGEACTSCGELFKLGQALKPVCLGIGYQLFAHVICPKKRTTR